jgi:hypothetical protein
MLLFLSFLPLHSDSSRLTVGVIQALALPSLQPLGPPQGPGSSLHSQQSAGILGRLQRRLWSLEQVEEDREAESRLRRIIKVSSSSGENLDKISVCWKKGQMALPYRQLLPRHWAGEFQLPSRCLEPALGQMLSSLVTV